MKKIYGIYNNSKEAQEAVADLVENGFSRERIWIISSKALDYIDDPNSEAYNEDDRSLWERIKDTFTFHEYNEDYWDRHDLEEEDKIYLQRYRQNLEDGDILVLIDEDPIVEEVAHPGDQTEEYVDPGEVNPYNEGIEFQAGIDRSILTEKDLDK